MKRLALLIPFLFISLLPLRPQGLKPCGTSMLNRCHHRLPSPDKRVGTRLRAWGKAPDDGRYIGERRGLIILVSFPDMPFSSSEANQIWSAIANQEGYAENGAIGSVSDYFRDQSYGQFRLTFDVVGPVEAAHEYAYYGRNIYWEEMDDDFDRNVGELVAEACRAVVDSVSFADYDWDGDGEVEEVYILYAGHGENDYSNSDVIWPHEAQLSVDWEGYEEGLTLQGLLIDTYACSNELSRSGALAGMGTFCHEFSHCLGLPDLYNTESGKSVLGRYDLMDTGSYNGHSSNGWCPVGYSSYERYAVGWLTPQPVAAPQSVTSLLPLHESPDVRIFRTGAEATDYYLIECRQKTSWDTYFPREGLLAWHIDYDEEAWLANEVNNNPNHLRVEYMLLSRVPSAVMSVPADVRPVCYYNLQGRRLSAPNGLSVVRYSDGSVGKVMMK